MHESQEGEKEQYCQFCNDTVCSLKQTGLNLMASLQQNDKKKRSFSYILLFNQEHPITRGWWGLQSKDEAHGGF